MRKALSYRPGSCRPLLTLLGLIVAHSLLQWWLSFRVLYYQPSYPACAVSWPYIRGFVIIQNILRIST